MQDVTGWAPTQEIELVAGTPPGGGQDRPASALIEVLTAHRLLAQPVKLSNIPGRGGGNAWDYLRKNHGNPHVLAINSPTIISNKLLGVAATDYSDLTPLANLYTEYPIFIVRAIEDAYAQMNNVDVASSLGKIDTTVVASAVEAVKTQLDRKSVV